MTSSSYRADVDEPDQKTPCICSDCDWSGPAEDTTDIVDCWLTPGDPSPVGRCPVCDSLAYIIKKETP